eukprot:76931_1
MAQPLMDLTVGYIKNNSKLKSLDIPDDISRICAKYINIDVIETTSDYPSSDYNIPFVFKPRQENDITLWFGCESYKVSASNVIKFYLPYAYMKETKEWYRVHGGTGNKNGKLAAQHLSYIMKLKYVKVDKANGQHFNAEATDKLKQMYYSAYQKESTPQIPCVNLKYQSKGNFCNDMAFFVCHSNCDMVIIYNGK